MSKDDVQNATTEYTDARANDLRKSVLTAMAEHTRASLSLARGLFETYYGTVKQKGVDTPLYTAWGYDSWDEYVEHELGMHMGTARQYVLVHDELVNRRGGAVDSTLPDSITKLKVLARVSKRVNDTRQLQRWVARSHELSCCQLDEEVDAVFGDGRPKRRNVSFFMKWSRIAPMMKTIRVAKENFGVASNADALAKIVDDWANDHAGQSRPKKAANGVR